MSEAVAFAVTVTIMSVGIALIGAAIVRAVA
jgi:hypothetical protein